MTGFDTVNEMENTNELVQVRLSLQEIARSEITRHRSRLASLTTEQQSAVEALLLSTADMISHQLIDRLQSYPEALQKKCSGVWNHALAA